MTIKWPTVDDLQKKVLEVKKQEFLRKSEVSAVYLFVSEKEWEVSTTYGHRDELGYLGQASFTNKSNTRIVARELLNVARASYEANMAPRCTCDDFCDGPCPAHPDPDNPYQSQEKTDDAQKGNGREEDGEIASGFYGFSPAPEALAFFNEHVSFVNGTPQKE